MINRLLGASINGKSLISPKRKAAIRNMTLASELRKISGSVNSGRPSKSCSEYNLTQIPLDTRPQRPARCLAAAWLIFSICNCSTLARVLYRFILASPASITYLMPGTVSEVSATLVANTIRRVEWLLNIFC